MKCTPSAGTRPNPASSNVTVYGPVCDWTTSSSDTSESAIDDHILASQVRVLLRREPGDERCDLLRLRHPLDRYPGGQLGHPFLAEHLAGQVGGDESGSDA